MINNPLIDPYSKILICKSLINLWHFHVLKRHKVLHELGGLWLDLGQLPGGCRTAQLGAVELAAKFPGETCGKPVGNWGWVG